jgi:diphthamide synthase (EF-2-diphthine--ammonia ligase)
LSFFKKEGRRNYCGNVYIEEHLKYLESIAKEVGATLIEPLWGMNSEELLYKEIESGIRAFIIGCLSKLKSWLGTVLERDNISAFIEDCKRLGVDPLGEKSGYHTLVLSSPLYREEVQYSKILVEQYSDYLILRLV